jgi:hypothetical protein
MRRPMLLAAVLTGCLALSALAEARDRHGQPTGPARSFSHQSFSHQSFAGRSFARQSFAGASRHRAGARWSGPPSGMRWAPPRQGPHGQPGWAHGQPGWAHGQPGWAHGEPGWWFGPRQHVQRFVGPGSVPPLSQLPGTRMLAGRQILPFVGQPGRLTRPFVFARPPRHKTFVQVFPRPIFPPPPGFVPGPRFPARAGFGIPRRPGGLTIIVREPAFVPRW